MRMNKLGSVKFTRLRFGIAGALIAVVIAGLVFTQVNGVFANGAKQLDKGPKTTTPIKHLVVIFQENVSFDHYFATYPYALNPTGEPAFYPLPDTPTINGLYNAIVNGKPTGPLAGCHLRPGSWIHCRATGL
jgi:phospholipase C